MSDLNLAFYFYIYKLSNLIMKVFYSYNSPNGDIHPIVSSSDPEVNYTYNSITVDYGRKSIWTHGQEFGYVGNVRSELTELINNTQEISATGISNIAERCENINNSLSASINDLANEIHSSTQIKILDSSKGESIENATDNNTIYFLV